VRRGGLPLGRSPGEKWARERFRSPNHPDFHHDHGVVIDTMETAFEWRALEAGHDAVVAAMRAAAEAHAGAGLAMGHLSHSYDDGACLYFVLLYPMDDARPIEQWRAIKAATTDAIVAAGGTVSHHHGVGVDHAGWLPKEKGELGVDVLRAVKARLDPAGLMNPGKVL
jgi:alkyldihydroxyacetonephosphate synthase